MNTVGDAIALAHFETTFNTMINGGGSGYLFSSLYMCRTCMGVHKLRHERRRGHGYIGRAML